MYGKMQRCEIIKDLRSLLVHSTEHPVIVFISFLSVLLVMTALSYDLILVELGGEQPFTLL